MTIKVSKLGAAKRQLDHAIETWFYEGDPVVIHALTAAAYEIVQNLHAKSGDSEFVMKEFLKKRIPDKEALEQVMVALRKPMVFFKHADRDPHAILEFNPDSNIPLMVLASAALVGLGEQKSSSIFILQCWTRIHHPRLYNEPELLEKSIPVAVFADIKKTNKREFFDLFKLALAKGNVIL
jgi:hypothetical protein